MGYATIVSGGADGRYVISLDWGESTKAALLAAISTLLDRLEIITADAQTKVNEGQALEDAAAAKYNEAVETFIATNQFQQPGSPRPDDRAIRFYLQRLRELQTLHEPRRIRLAALKFERAQALKRVAYWTTFQASETRSVWCVDFTEDAAPGSVVATLDIPGESSLMVLGPGARAWTPSDGQLVARELMSPEQVFFNAAILPGWQIDAPTYRWGTVTAVDYAGDTLDVTLADATSSAQRLDINRETSLAAVPVDYMNTGAVVFEVDDRVVVQFIGQSWDSPRVLGFLDNPRVPNWTCVHRDNDEYYFKSRIPSLMSSIVSGPKTVEIKVMGGDWEAADEFIAGFHRVIFDNDDPNPENTAAAQLVVAPETLYGPGAYIILGIAFMHPVVPVRPLAVRSYAEFRITIGGEVVFNAAIADAGYPTDTDQMGYAKAPGSIRLNEDAFEDSSEAVSIFPYTLTGSST